jgi:hypothetical protein
VAFILSHSLEKLRCELVKSQLISTKEVVLLNILHHAQTLLIDLLPATHHCLEDAGNALRMGIGLKGLDHCCSQSILVQEGLLDPCGAAKEAFD